MSDVLYHKIEKTNYYQQFIDTDREQITDLCGFGK